MNSDDDDLPTRPPENVQDAHYIVENGKRWLDDVYIPCCLSLGVEPFEPVDTTSFSYRELFLSIAHAEDWSVQLWPSHGAWFVDVVHNGSPLFRTSPIRNLEPCVWKQLFNWTQTKQGLSERHMLAKRDNPPTRTNR